VGDDARAVAQEKRRAHGVHCAAVELAAAHVVLEGFRRQSPKLAELAPGFHLVEEELTLACHDFRQPGQQLRAARPLGGGQVSGQSEANGRQTEGGIEIGGEEGAQDQYRSHGPYGPHACRRGNLLLRFHAALLEG